MLTTAVHVYIIYCLSYLLHVCSEPISGVNLAKSSPPLCTVQNPHFRLLFFLSQDLISFSYLNFINYISLFQILYRIAFSGSQHIVLSSTVPSSVVHNSTQSSNAHFLNFTYRIHISVGLSVPKIPTIRGITQNQTPIPNTTKCLKYLEKRELNIRIMSTYHTHYLMYPMYRNPPLCSHTARLD